MEKMPDSVIEFDLTAKDDGKIYIQRFFVLLVPAFKVFMRGACLI
jgi:hypothetical protein